jgi:hypothetical protein
MLTAARIHYYGLLARDSRVGEKRVENVVLWGDADIIIEKTAILIRDGVSHTFWSPT